MLTVSAILAASVTAYVAAPAAWAAYTAAALTLATALFLLQLLDQYFLGYNAVERTMALYAGFLSQEKGGNISVKSLIDEYNDLYKNTGAAAAAERKIKYAGLVDAYYNVVTLFYEWGWGASFHFAYLLRGENFLASIRRHEYYLASRLNVDLGQKLLDVGCGIGGPLLNIARFGRWDITGITINQHQVQRGTQLIAEAGLSQTARIVQGDFNSMPFAASSFDGAYAIEATCHAPKRESVYGQVFKVLKPGSRFALYEWVMTDKYIPGNPEHERIKHLVEEGDALPSLTVAEECIDALKTVGFELEETRDMVLDLGQHMPWYWPLMPSWNPLLFRFQLNPLGREVTKVILKVLEAVRLAPQGSAKVQAMLQKGAEGLHLAGVTGIMTPMLLLVARKPRSAN